MVVGECGWATRVFYARETSVKKNKKKDPQLAGLGWGGGSWPAFAYYTMYSSTTDAEANAATVMVKFKKP